MYVWLRWEGSLPVACEQMPARQRNSIRKESYGDWPNMIKKLVWSHKWKSAFVILFLLNLFIWTQAAGGSSERMGRGLDERGRVHNRQGQGNEQRELGKTDEGEGSRMMRGTMHKYAWWESERGEGGSKWGRVKDRDCIGRFPSEDVWGRKKQASHRHYRSILTDLLLLFLANNSSFLDSSDIYPLIHPLLTFWMCQANLSSKQKARDKERNGARERLDQAMICVSSRRYSSSPHAPLLAASYSLSFCFSISPSRSTHACSCCMATTC